MPISPVFHLVFMVIHRLVQVLDHLVIRPAIKHGVRAAKERKKQRTQAVNSDTTRKGA
jgi:hypothetical protein